MEIQFLQWTTTAKTEDNYAAFFEQPPTAMKSNLILRGSVIGSNKYDGI
jgi:hypothetical protein